MPITIQKPKQLMVEGMDCLYFINALLAELKLADMVQVHDFGGVKSLQGFVGAFARMPGFSEVTSLGIVRDAESDPNGAFRSAFFALERSNLPAPQRPGQPAGTIPRTNIFILPDPASEGMLETLCLQSVAGDPATACVDAFFECLSMCGVKPGNLPKARVQTFLASREKPGLRLGEAAAKGYWPWESPVFGDLKHFLQSL